jgi:glyoxylase-like metal-dependent hydrolase (beta-lactamase superfamily II)
VPTSDDETRSTSLEDGLYQVVFAAKSVPLSQCVLRGAEPTPVDFTYAFWVLVRPAGVVLVDTGFGEEVARRRGIDYRRRPVDALAALGVSPADVTDVVLTHLHFDHAGGLRDLHAARIHVQRADVAFYTGPAMRFPLCASAVEKDDLAALAEAEEQGRLHLLDGDGSLFDGVTVHNVGGHTPGSQIVEVTAPRGRVVLASDVAHLYDNLERRVPFPVLHDLPSCCEAFETVDRLAAEGAVVVPGHDGRVLERHPSVPGFDPAELVRLG